MTKFTVSKELARTLLQGWCEQSNREVGCYEAMLPFVANEDDARILTLFSHWSSDLTVVFGTAAHIRLTIERTDDHYHVVDTGSPPLHLKQPYWSPGTLEWVRRYKKYKWVPGKWEEGFQEEETEEGPVK